MALVGGGAAPPLRHANSESRLLARQRAGSAVLGLPGLNPCSSAAHCGHQILEKKVPCYPRGGQQSYDGATSLSTLDGLSCLHDQNERGCNAAPSAHAAGTGNEHRTALPPLPAAGRGSVRLGSPQNGLRPAKRSRSTSGLCDVQNLIGQEGGVPLKNRSQLGSLPSLSACKSAGAIASCQKKDSRLDSEVEDVLQTALNSKPGVHKATQKLCCSTEAEAHFEQLMNLLDGKENNSFLPQRKGRRARVSDSHGDNENKIQRKGTGFIHLSPLSGNVGARRAHIVDDHGDNENKLFRKGTGFVQLSASEKESQRHAKVVDDHGDNENNIHRKGTGFIHLSSLPKESPSVTFPDRVGDHVNHIQRKGTGFVFLQHVAPRVRIVDNHGDNENRLQRKGTGFIDLSECKRDLLPGSPGSCSTRTVDSPDLCQDASDTDVASEYDGADAYEEEMSLAEIQ